MLTSPLKVPTLRHSVMSSPWQADEPASQVSLRGQCRCVLLIRVLACRGFPTICGAGGRQPEQCQRAVRQQPPRFGDVRFMVVARSLFLLTSLSSPLGTTLAPVADEHRRSSLPGGARAPTVGAWPRRPWRV